jgi:hypothetical protein
VGQLPGQDSNLDKENQNTFQPERNYLVVEDFGSKPSSLTVQLTGAAPIDPDLARLVVAWPSLPPHIRAAILALTNTTTHT